MAGPAGKLKQINYYKYINYKYELSANNSYNHIYFFLQAFSLNNESSMILIDCKTDVTFEYHKLIEHHREGGDG